MANSAAPPDPGPQLPNKDEVGWSFVKQFYTTLNQAPHKLHLYYKKQSALKYGNEDGIAQTFVGQRAIHDKIQSLGFKDCLVMLSTVDSLESENGGIIIQVVGELSNAGLPSQKFTESFFLAAQPPNGYFVLNDIFRYIKDDVDSDFEDMESDPLNEIDVSETPEHHPVPEILSNGFHSDLAPTEHPLSEPTTSIESPIASRLDSEQVSRVSQSLQDTDDGLDSKDPPLLPDQITVTTFATDATESSPNEPVPTENENHHGKENLIFQPQSEKDDAPSENSQSGPTATEPAPAKTWATLAATNREKWASPTEPKPPSSGTLPLHPKNTNQPIVRRESAKPVSQDKPEAALGYIKHVGPKVQKGALHDLLVKFGHIKDLDINRQKSCGFVEYSSNSALQAAIAAGPMEIGENKIVVEERRKSAKTTEPKVGKQLMGDRKGGAKTDDRVTSSPRKPARPTMNAGTQKSRSE